MRVRLRMSLATRKGCSPCLGSPPVALPDRLAPFIGSWTRRLATVPPTTALAYGLALARRTGLSLGTTAAHLRASLERLLPLSRAGTGFSYLGLRFSLLPCHERGIPRLVLVGEVPPLRREPCLCTLQLLDPLVSGGDLADAVLV